VRSRATPYVGSRRHRPPRRPTVQRSGENEVILYPNELAPIRVATAAGPRAGAQASADHGPQAIPAVDRRVPL
jgi:hypothetical protein